MNSTVSPNSIALLLFKHRTDALTSAARSADLQATTWTLLLNEGLVSAHKRYPFF